MNTLPVKLSDQELEDLFDCARERHVDPFELMRRVILEELVR